MKTAEIIVVISLLARDDCSLHFCCIFPYSPFSCRAMAYRILFMGFFLKYGRSVDENLWDE